MLDTWIDMLVIKDRPILGIGLGNIELYNQYKAGLSTGQSSSNGILEHIRNVGFVGTMILFYPFLFFGMKSKNSLMVVFCNITSGLTQGIIMTPVFLLSMLMIYKKPRLN